jgi:hypothetical protein
VSRREREPAIVAELGRPETPEETAARKAQNSRNHRDRQTTRNLLLALGASLAVVAFLVLLVPRSDSPILPEVDYRAAAEQASADIGAPVVVPDVPEGWSANAAELRTAAADGVVSWYIGFLTPEREFVAFSQGIDANESWLSDELNSSRATGTAEIGGEQWQVYDYRDAVDRGNLEYALSLELDGDFYLVRGTAGEQEATALAEAVTTSIGAL